MNFIVLGDPRVGTTMLVYYLKQQKNIFCYREVFNPKRFQFNEITQNLQIQFKDVDKKSYHLCNSPEELLKIAENLNPNKLLGFKIFYKQCRGVEKQFNFSVLDYIKNNNLKIIILHRRNLFLKSLSYQKAKYTSVFNVSKKLLSKTPNILDEINVKINFDVEKYLKDRLKSKDAETEFKHFFMQNNIQVYEAYYEDLIGEDNVKYYKEIIKFLEGTDENFIEVKDIQYFKLNQYTVEQQVKNYKDLLIALKDDVYFQEAISVQKLLLDKKQFLFKF